MISVENLSKNFGGIQAVNDVSLTIEAGSITGLIGPNGAGKTTLFNVIAGLYSPSAGRVVLDGEDITGLPPHELFAKGMLRTFQIAHEFSTLTVRENLSYAAMLRLPASLSFGAKMARVDEVIGELQMERIADVVVGSATGGGISGGQKRKLMLGIELLVPRPTEPHLAPLLRGSRSLPLPRWLHYRRCKLSMTLFEGAPLLHKWPSKKEPRDDRFPTG